MGWRFQRRVQILPGVRLNISKSGVSTSFGAKQFGWYTINRHGKRLTVDTPIPGLWHTSYKRHDASQPQDRTILPREYFTMREFQTRHGMVTTPSVQPSNDTITVAALLGWIIVSVLIGVGIGYFLSGG